MAKLVTKKTTTKVVFIIDECHRSQFGDMHRDIVRHFNKAQGKPYCFDKAS